jgi:hypothetical protein
VVDVGDDRLDLDRAVDPAELARGGLGLGEVVGDVLLVEEDLPLEVVRLDEVAVDEPDVADPGADEVVRQHGAERPAAAEGDAAGHQPALARLAQPVEADLAAVTIQGVEAIRFEGHGFAFAMRGRGLSAPAMAGMMLISSWAATVVARSSMKRMSSLFT